MACQQKSGRQCGAYAKTRVLTYYPDSSVNKAPVLCSMLLKREVNHAASFSKFPSNKFSESYYNSVDPSIPYQSLMGYSVKSGLKRFEEIKSLASQN